jgi:hypothetical protein
MSRSERIWCALRWSGRGGIVAVGIFVMVDLTRGDWWVGYHPIDSLAMAVACVPQMILLAIGPSPGMTIFADVLLGGSSALLGFGNALHDAYNERGATSYENNARLLAAFWIAAGLLLAVVAMVRVIVDSLRDRSLRGLDLDDIVPGEVEV